MNKYGILIDKEDEHLLTEHSWRLDNVTPVTTITNRKIPLKRMVTNAQPGTFVTPRNGNQLDVRKENLKITVGKATEPRKDEGVGITHIPESWMVRVGTSHIGSYPTYKLALEARKKAIETK